MKKTTYQITIYVEVAPLKEEVFALSSVMVLVIRTPRSSLILFALQDKITVIEDTVE